MKNLFLTITAFFCFSAVSFASSIGDGSLEILKTEKIYLSLESEIQKEFILATTFSTETESVSMLFESNVSMVQVYNLNGELEMMFPIGSNDVSLGLSLFKSGEYRMGFVVDGMDGVQFTKLTVK